MEARRLDARAPARYGKNAFKGQDRFGQTPLHLAALNGQYDACAVIIKSAAGAVSTSLTV